MQADVDLAPDSLRQAFEQLFLLRKCQYSAIGVTPSCCASRWGRLADVFGRRRLFVIGLSVFTLASLAAGLAGSGGVLIGARVLQGLGAALLVPTTLAIIIATFTDARERAAAVGA